MVTVTGGKWTTYRLVAEQAVDLATSFHQLHVPTSTTRQIDLASDDAAERARILDKSPQLGVRLDPSLPYCGVDFVMATRRDLAVRVGDALAYRTRAMFLNARVASTIAPRVAALMASELGRDDDWVVREVQTARQMASEFMPDPIPAPTSS
jgi:glycerol-3-phosphate dehydrogenase